MGLILVLVDFKIVSIDSTPIQAYINERNSIHSAKSHI